MENIFFSLLFQIQSITLLKLSPCFLFFPLQKASEKSTGLPCLSLYLYWSKESEIQSALFRKLRFHESVHHLVVPISLASPQTRNWVHKATLVSSSMDLCLFHFRILSLTFSDAIRTGFGDRPGSHSAWLKKPPNVARLPYYISQ